MSPRETNGHRPLKPGIELPETVPHEVPPMPDGDWHVETLKYWRSIWQDPISVLWTDADRTTVGLLLDLVEELHQSRDSGEKLSARNRQELRSVRTELGLTPAGRLKLLGKQKPRRAAAPRPAMARPRTYTRLDGTTAQLGDYVTDRAIGSDPDLHTERDIRTVLGSQS